MIATLQSRFNLSAHGNSLLLLLLCLASVNHRPFISRSKGKGVCRPIADQMPLVCLVSLGLDHIIHM